MLKEKEEEMARLTKFRIRFQEAGGIKLGQLFSTNLGAGGPCGRLDCQPCESRDEKRPNCKAQSILYESKCNICNKDETSSRQEEKGQRKGIYIGESSRSLYERSKEHLKDAEDFSPSSHMVKHWMHAHEEMKTCPDFSFTILSRFRDCLSRQVAEAIQILYTKDQILNSKNEYMANCLTRICVEENKFERKKREREEEKEEEKELQKLEAFKITHKRPKRGREMHLEAGPAMKRMRIIQKDGEISQEDGETFQKDGRDRVEALRARMDEEREIVLKRMKELDERRILEGQVGVQLESLADGQDDHHHRYEAQHHQGEVHEHFQEDQNHSKDSNFSEARGLALERLDWTMHVAPSASKLRAKPNLPKVERSMSEYITNQIIMCKTSLERGRGRPSST